MEYNTSNAEFAKLAGIDTAGIPDYKHDLGAIIRVILAGGALLIIEPEAVTVCHKRMIAREYHQFGIRIRFDDKLTLEQAAMEAYKVWYKPVELTNDK